MILSFPFTLVSIFLNNFSLKDLTELPQLELSQSITTLNYSPGWQVTLGISQAKVESVLPSPKIPPT